MEIREITDGELHIFMQTVVPVGLDSGMSLAKIEFNQWEAPIEKIKGFLGAELLKITGHVELVRSGAIRADCVYRLTLERIGPISEYQDRKRKD